MITINEGNVYQSAATFTGESGVVVDPTSVAFVYILNSDPTTKVTLTYTNATVPAPGVVARTAAGNYVAQVSLASISGTLESYWESTGVGQATSTSNVVVVPALPF